MSLLLAIHSYPGANEACHRHYQFWKNSGADSIIGIGTVQGLLPQFDNRPDLKCEWPDGMESVEIGGNSYINGPHLPQRLIDTLKWFLSGRQEDFICIAEYDTIFKNPIKPLPRGLSGHMAGGKPNGLACNYFLHPPWAMDRETAKRMIEGGETLIHEGEYVGGTPDCFIGWLTERFNIPVLTGSWTEFSRNSMDCCGDLEMARNFWREGVDVIHGVKTSQELNFITK